MTAIAALIDVFAQEHPNDFARLLDRGEVAEVVRVLERMDRESAARLLSRMNATRAADVLTKLARDEAAQLMAAAGPSRAALILSHVDAATRAALLERMSGREAEAVRRLLVHGARTAGSVMDAMVLSIAEDATAGEALQQAKQHAQHALFYLYVVDRDQLLVGVITLTELLGAEPSASVQSLMTDRPAAIGSRASLLAIAAHPAWREQHALPVVDERGALLGAIRYEAMRRIESELGQAVKQSDMSQTAGALGQLYAIGALGMVEWMTALTPSKRRGDGV
ncbi:MAG TPA: CBS domain-containing protein [Polyangiales bacterium]|nr:CBS domain-containing protein [Polyangiales bacterium]